jgi:hypothetical protein
LFEARNAFAGQAKKEDKTNKEERIKVDEKL